MNRNKTGHSWKTIGTYHPLAGLGAPNASKYLQYGKNQSTRIIYVALFLTVGDVLGRLSDMGRGSRSLVILVPWKPLMY
jgi:hypothetical protein